MRPVIYFNPIALPKTKLYVPLWNRHVVYPKFTPGDPQQRMFLPPFWMKMVYPGKECSNRLAVFKVHPQMTEWDIQQYLEKVYKVPVSSVHLKMLYHDLASLDAAEDKTRVIGGNYPHLLPREPERYEKVAYVHLAPGHEFKFPDLFKEKRPSEEINRILEQAEKTVLQPSKEDQDEDAKNKALETPKTTSDEISRDRNLASSLISNLPRWFS